MYFKLPISALDAYYANTAANFPFLANSYYWDGSVNSGVTEMLEVTGGTAYDPSGTMTEVANGVAIANNTSAPTTLALPRTVMTTSKLFFMSGKPDFNTTAAGVIFGASNVDGVSILQSDAFNVVFTVGDDAAAFGGGNCTASVASADNLDRTFAIHVKNTAGSVTADYYLVAEDGSAITTGVMTKTGALPQIPLVNTAVPVIVTRFPADTGALRAMGILHFTAELTATEIKSFLSWMHWQVVINQKRGLFPGFVGKA